MAEEKLPKRYYVSGFQIAQAKKLCEFLFGDYFVSIKMNTRDVVFDIKLKRSIKIEGKDVKIEDYIDLADFKSFWGPQWRLVYEVLERV